MGKYVNVEVEFADSRVIKAVPDVKVYRFDPTGADSIRWIVKGVPKGYSVVVKWDIESPFQNFGAESSVDPETVVLKATGLKGIGGFFRYSILLVDGQENVIAGVDPGVSDVPWPPHGGEG